MTKNIFEYFKSIGLTPDDVNTIIECVPEILDVKDEEIVGNIELVIKYGYPRSDVATLIQINPSFLISSEELLDDLLRGLAPDVEEKLKENPFLI